MSETGSAAAARRDDGILNADVAGQGVEAAIAACVGHFYELARADDLIGPIFGSHVAGWDAHLALMRDFWSRAILGTERYTGAPLPPHVTLRLRQAHFDRWRDLWREAARAELPESAAARAIAVGDHLAHCWGHSLDSLTRAMQQAEAGAS